MNEVTRILSISAPGDPAVASYCCRWSTTSCASSRRRNSRRRDSGPVEQWPDRISVPPLQENQS